MGILMKTIMIGAGGIATQHGSALQKLGAEILGIYDVNRERAESLSRRFKCRTLESPEDMIHETDMVHILTPPSMRRDYVELAARNKKHIFLEKPVSITQEDAVWMEETIKREGVRSMIGFTQRFRKGYRRIKEWQELGLLGEVTQVYSFRMGPGPGFGGRLNDSWRTTSGMVCGMTIESLSHDIDFLSAIGGEIADAAGFTKGTVEALPQFDNNVTASMHFQSGAIGSITASWSSHIPFNIKGVIGTQGSVLLQGEDIWDNTQITATLKNGEKITETLNDIFQEGEGYLEENRYFIECIQRNRPNICDISAGRRVLELSRQILRSKDGSI